MTTGRGVPICLCLFTTEYNCPFKKSVSTGQGLEGTFDYGTRHHAQCV